jgi:hypothetical protein
MRRDVGTLFSLTRRAEVGLICGIAKQLCQSSGDFCAAMRSRIISGDGIT